MVTEREHIKKPSYGEILFDNLNNFNSSFKFLFFYSKLFDILCLFY